MRLINKDSTLDKLADYVGSGMSMNDFDAISKIVEEEPTVCVIEQMQDDIIEALQNKIKVPDDDFDCGKNTGIQLAILVVRRKFKKLMQTEGE